jgi:hypothetical protein
MYLVTKNELRELCNQEYCDTTNLVLAPLLASGLLFMAVAGFSVAPKPYVTATASGTSEVSAVRRDSDGVSAFELMNGASPQLPVRPEDEPTF